MDSDMMSMMMQQMEKLPDFFNPNPNYQNAPTFPSDHRTHQTQTISNTNTHPIYYNPNQMPPDLISQELGLRYRSDLISAPFSLSGISSNSYPSILLDKRSSSSNNNNNNMAAMREMIFRIAVMQPIHMDPEAVKPAKRRNVRISKDPQSVAARHRRERISERIRILQRLVPGGTKMDTASMLDEAIHYVKFLKKQVQTLEEQAVVNGGGRVALMSGGGPGVVTTGTVGGGGYGNGVVRGCGQSHQIVGNIQMLRGG